MSGNTKHPNDKDKMINNPCRYDDNLTCWLENCTIKCSKNIYHTRDDDNDKKID